MCALEAALFSLQQGTFSCRDAHAFNRHSHWQDIANMRPSPETQNFRLFAHDLFPFSSPLRAYADALSRGRRCRIGAGKDAEPAIRFTHTWKPRRRRNSSVLLGSFAKEDDDGANKMLS